MVILASLRSLQRNKRRSLALKIGQAGGRAGRGRAGRAASQAAPPASKNENVMRFFALLADGTHCCGGGRRSDDDDDDPTVPGRSMRFLHFTKTHSCCLLLLLEDFADILTSLFFSK